MKVLVSLCNKMRHDQYPGVYLVELNQSLWRKGIRVRPIYIQDERLGGLGGFTGLANQGSKLFLVTQSIPPRLVQLNSRYELEKVWELKHVADGHSVVVADTKAYIASTGNDRIVEVDLKTGIETILWKHGDANSDTVHVNSLLYRKGRLLATMFGAKQDSWKSAKDGMVYDITGGKVYHAPIHHPHSLCRVVHPAWGLAFWRNKLRRTKKKHYYCESWARTICTTAGDRLVVDKGYTRGLAVTDDHLFVGLSKSRKVSKSTGQANLADPTWSDSICGVCVYRVNHERLDASPLLKVVPLDQFGNEIYDVLPLAA
jgi:hypothetical protein